MDPQKHAPGGNPSPKLSSELTNLKMLVEAHDDRSPEGLQALDNIKAALHAAEAGREDEARTIVADAWAWVKDNLSLSGIAENASELSKTLADGASDLGEKLLERWSTLFDGDAGGEGEQADNA